LNPRPVNRKSNVLPLSHHATWCMEWRAKSGSTFGSSAPALARTSDVRALRGRRMMYSTVAQVDCPSALRMARIKLLGVRHIPDCTTLRGLTSYAKCDWRCGQRNKAFDVGNEAASVLTARRNGLTKISCLRLFIQTLDTWLVRTASRSIGAF